MEFKEYNHMRELVDFEEQLDEIRKAGFKPIAVTQMFFEDTFVFKTQEEADKAYHLLERDEHKNWIVTVVGWWYGKSEFFKAVKEYESNKNNYEVLIYWL